MNKELSMYLAIFNFKKMMKQNAYYMLNMWLQLTYKSYTYPESKSPLILNWKRPSFGGVQGKRQDTQVPDRGITLLK